MADSLIKPQDRFWNDLVAIFDADLDSPLVLSLLVLYVVCFLDVTTTSMILSHGGAELNPLMDFFARLTVHASPAEMAGSFFHIHYSIVLRTENPHVRNDHYGGYNPVVPDRCNS